MFTFDCLFHQYVNEWALPIERTEEVLRSLDRLIQGGKFNIHFPIEVRFVKGDDIWLSPNYGGDRVWIGTVMYRPYGKDADDWARWFEEFERLMISFGTTLNSKSGVFSLHF
jgi:L-gulonolactone oxidase